MSKANANLKGVSTRSLIFAVLVILAGWALLTWLGGSSEEVTDFASCVRAGNPVLPTVPGQCNHGGKVYRDSVPTPQ